MTVALGYHDVVPRQLSDSSGFPGEVAARYKLDPGQFEAHLEAIASTGVAIGLVGPGFAPAAALTFDDAGSSAVAVAEMLERRGWCGHFFVPTAFVGRAAFLAREQLQELVLRGHVVGSHPHSHPTYFGRLLPEEMALEWRRSRDVLGELLGEPPVHAALPGGYLSVEAIDAAAEAGFRVLMTSEPLTSVRVRAALTIFGRFAVWATTSPGTAAAYVRGARWARARLGLEWKAKRTAKSISPPAYDVLRAFRASLRRR